MTLQMKAKKFYNHYLNLIMLKFW